MSHPPARAATPARSYCRQCVEPTRHRDDLGAICPWCASETLSWLDLKEAEQLAQAAAENATRPRWAGRAFANIVPRNLSGVRQW